MSLLCVVSLLGCSTQSTLRGPADGGLASAHEHDDGTVHLLDDRGDRVTLRADDTLRVTVASGETISMRGSQVCRSQDGLSMRRSGDSCAGATWIAGWDDVTGIEVDQFNGAATVGITATIAVVVAGVILVAMASKGGSSGSHSSGSHSSGSHSSGSGRVAASPTTGGARVGGGSGGGRGPVLVPGAVGGGAPRHASHGSPRGGGGDVVSLNISTSNNTVGSYESPPPPEEPAPEPEVGPLFSRQAVRRASVRPSLRLDLTGCVSEKPCTAENLRLGLLVGDLVELSGGLRLEQTDKQTALLPQFGFGLQGRFPSQPSLAIYLGTQFAFGPLVRLQPQIGLRMRPVADLWIGLNPLALTYLATENRVAYSPSLDLAYEF